MPARRTARSPVPATLPTNACPLLCPFCCTATLERVGQDANEEVPRTIRPWRRTAPSYLRSYTRENAFERLLRAIATACYHWAASLLIRMLRYTASALACRSRVPADVRRRRRRRRSCRASARRCRPAVSQCHQREHAASPYALSQRL